MTAAGKGSLYIVSRVDEIKVENPVVNGNVNAYNVHA